MINSCKERFLEDNNDALSKKIKTIYRKLFYNQKNDDVVFNQINKLEKLLLDINFSKNDERKILNFSLNTNMVPFFQKIYEKHETNLENKFAEKILLNSKEKISNYHLYNRFNTLIQNEIKLANISSKDNLLFIGSGSFPISAILFENYLNCNISCYDKNLVAVKKSKEVLKKMNLDEKINVYNKDGCNLNENNYDVIVLALLSKPKKELLHKIKPLLNYDTKLICRTSDVLREFFYEKTPIEELKKYNVVDKTYAKYDQTISSILLKK
ncbi:MAG: nicotianamine synthase family protein [Nanoarchaeota archaeon]